MNSPVSDRCSPGSPFIGLPGLGKYRPVPAAHDPWLEGRITDRKPVGQLRRPVRLLIAKTLDAPPHYGSVLAKAPQLSREQRILENLLWKA